MPSLRRQFQLEPLEPRVMLSGEGLLLPASAQLLDGSSAHAENQTLAEAIAPASELSIETAARNSASQVEDIFSGIAPQNLSVGNETEQREEASEAAKASDTDSPSAAPEHSDLNPVAADSPSREQLTSHAAVLTATLRSANGPPAFAVFADALEQAENLLIDLPDPSASIGIGAGAKGDFVISQEQLNELPANAVLTVGKPNGNHIVEIGSPGRDVYLHNPLVISTPEEGGEVHLLGNIIGTGNASLTIFGSGHTTTISSNQNITGDYTINDSVVISGSNRIVTATGNVSINNPGVINANTDGADSLTINAGGSVTIGGSIGATKGLNNLTINAGSNVTFQGSIWIYGTLTINVEADPDPQAGGNVLFQGPVHANAIVVNADNAKSIVNFADTVFSTTSITVNGGLETSFIGNITAGDFVTLTAKSKVLQQANIVVGTGKTVTVEAYSGPITMDSGTSTTTSGTAGNIYYTAQNNVALGTLTADGVIEVTSIQGAITNAQTGTAANLAGNRAVLSAATGIGAAKALNTKLVALDARNSGVTGDIVINELAAGASLSIHRLSQSNAGGNGNLSVSTEAGSLTVTAGQNGVTNAGTGTIHLTAVGAASDLIVGAAISSTTGAIQLDAGRQLATNAVISATGAANLTLYAANDVDQNENVSSTGGNITIDATNAGIDVASGKSTITTGTGTIQYHAGTTLAVAGISSGGVVTLQAGGGVTLRNAITAPAGFTSAGTSFDNTGATVTTTNTRLIVNHTGSIVVGGRFSSGTGNILVRTTGVTSNVTVNQSMETLGGNISVVAGNNVDFGALGQASAAGAGTVEVEAVAGAITMSAGSKLQTAAKNIRIKAAQNIALGLVDARSVNDRAGAKRDEQANWGSVSVQSVSGSITGGNLFAQTLRFNAAGGIGTNALPVETEAIAVSAAGSAGGIYLLEATDVTVDTVGQIPAERVQSDGTTVTIQSAAAQSDLVTTSNGSISLRTKNGSITINDGTAPSDTTGVRADGNGAVKLEAIGANQVLKLAAQVRSGSGPVTLRAVILLLDPEDIVTSGAVQLITGAGNFGVTLSGQFEWIGQGPIQTTGGQIQGMDDQGKPVSGAVQAVAVDPNNPNIVYVASVNGGIWKTDNINATKKIEYLDASKIPGPATGQMGYRVSSLFEFSATLANKVGNTGSGTFAAAVFSRISFGGGVSTPATATIGATATQNEIELKATQNGELYNQVSVVLLDTLAARGSETAHYDLANRALIVQIKAGASTAQDIVNAINEAVLLSGGVNAGSGAVTTVTMKALSAAITAAGTGYRPGDSITVAGGTSTIPTILNVAAVKVVGAVTIANGGNGYAVDDILTLVGGVGTITKLRVTTIGAGGAITAVSIESAGAYTVIPAGDVPVATAHVGAAGALVRLNWGVQSVSVGEPGSYTVLPGNPASQSGTTGGGLNAAFNVNWGVHSIIVNAPGSGYTSSQTLQFPGQGASAVVADLQAVTATVVNPGLDYTIGTTLSVDGGTWTTSALLTVTALRVVDATVNVAGSGYSVGDELTILNGVGTSAIVVVETLDGTVNNGIGTVTIRDSGSYTTAPGAIEAVSAGMARLNLKFGIDTVAITTAGAYTELPANPVTPTRTGGAGAGGTFDLGWGVKSVSVIATGNGYVHLPVLEFSGAQGTGTIAQPTMKVGAASVFDPGSGYKPNDTITIAGGTGTAALLTVSHVQAVGIAAITAGGAGYQANQILTVSNVTATVAAQIKVLTVNGSGAILTAAIERAGSHTAVPAGNVTVTGGTGSNATFTINWGVETLAVTNAGAYTILPSNPAAQSATSGSGVNAKLNLSWALHSVAIVNPGHGYRALPLAVISGQPAATTTMKAVGVSVTAPGSGYLPGQTITIAGGTQSAAVKLNINTVKLAGTVTIAAGGAGYQANQILSVTGGVFGTQATIKVLTVDGSGAVLTAQIEAAGVYATVPGSEVAVTGGTGANARFRVHWGVESVSILSAGSYTALPANAVAQQSSSGAGLNAQFNLTWGINTVIVSQPGANFISVPSVTFFAGKKYQYKVVFEDAFGHQSNASLAYPADGITLGPGQHAITLVNLPVGPDGTVKRLIYRTEGNGELFKLLGEIRNNRPLEVFTDRWADADLGAEREVELPYPVWTPLSDQLATLALSSIEFAPGSSTTFYVGSGKFSSSGSSGRSIGVFKTTDGGQTFTLVGGDELRDLSIRKLLTHTYTDVHNATIELVLAGTLQNDDVQSGGLFLSRNGGADWERISGKAGSGLPIGSVTDLISIQKPGEPANRIFYAAVTGDGSAFINTSSGVFESQGNDPIANPSWIAFRLGSNDPAAWKALGNNRSFRITINGVTKEITPQFGTLPDGMANLQPVLDKIRDALNDALTGFGVGATEVTLDGTFVFIKNRLNTGKVERLEHPTAGTGTSLLVSPTGGLYVSTNHGDTWSLVASTNAALLNHLREGQRIALAVHGADTNTPTLFIAVIVKEKLNGLYRLDLPGEAVRFVMETPVSIEKNRATVLSVKAHSADHNQWLALAANHQFAFFVSGVGKYIDPDFSAVTSMEDVAKALENAINQPELFGPGMVTVQWIRNPVLTEDNGEFRFISNAALNISIGDQVNGKLSLFDLPTAAGAHFNKAPAVFDQPGALDTRNPIEWVSGNVPDLTVMPQSEDPAVWRTLGRIHGFSITANGKTRDIIPDFSAVNNMIEVAAAMQTAMNDPLFGFGAGTITVEWNANLRRFIFNNKSSDSGLSVGGPQYGGLSLIGSATAAGFSGSDVPQATATLKATGIQIINRGKDYAPGDTITLSGGLRFNPVELLVSRVTVEAIGQDAQGTGYRDGDVLTFVGGVGTSAQVTVTKVSKTGRILKFELANAGSYTSLAGIGASIAVTGGHGMNATFLVDWGLLAVTFNNAGSYVEVPSNPATQGATSGGGSGATFEINWGIDTVSLQNSGSGFTAVPNIAFVGGGGAQATASATLKAVALDVQDRGSGYVIGETITLDGGAFNTPVIVRVTELEAESFTIHAGGNNYRVNDQITLDTGMGNANEAVLIVTSVDGAGAITGLSFVDRGEYNYDPIADIPVTVDAGPGLGAVIRIAWGVNRAVIDDAGDYSDLPANAVAQSGTSGAGAGASFNIDWGLSAVTVQDSGTGYTDVPPVRISGGGGSGANAQVTMKVIGATVTAQGRGYAPDDTIDLDGGTFTTRASLRVTHVQLSALTGLAAAGNGYVVDQIYTITGGTFGQQATIKVTSIGGGGAITGATIWDPGSYTAIPGTTVDVQGGARLNVAWGVEKVSVDNPGAYTKLTPHPTKQSATSGAGVDAKFVVAWGLNDVTVRQSGAGYTAAPVVTFGSLGGRGAVAEAKLKAVSASVQAAGTGYKTGEVITLALGTGAATTKAALQVASVKVVGNPTVAAGGAGYQVNDLLTVFGGTGQAAILKVTALNGTAIQTVQVVQAGSYTRAPDNNVSVTGGSGSGARFTLAWGVDRVVVSTAGVYSALPANAVAQESSTGAGTNATFNVTWGVAEVAITNAGSEFTLPPVVVLYGGQPGSAAAATANLRAVTVNPANRGTGYLPGDTITLDAATSTETLVITVETVQIKSLTFVSRGHGYKKNDVLTVVGGAGAALARFKVLAVNGTGAIQKLQFVNGGGSYSTVPVGTANLSGGSVGAAGAQVTLEWEIENVSIKTAGKYTVLPANKVNQTATSGAGAGATFDVFWGVNEITVSNAGSSYSPGAQVIIFGTNGVGATGTAVLKAVGASILNPGHGYVVGETLTLTGGSSTTAAVATVRTLRAVGAPVITTSGSGYQVGDLLLVQSGTFTTQARLRVTAVNGAGAIQGVEIETAGSYTVLPPNNVSVGTGAAQFTLAWGVNTVDITTAGSYTQAPQNGVSSVASAAGADAKLQVSWGIDSVKVTNPGTLYRTLPKVGFVNPVTGVQIGADNAGHANQLAHINVANTDATAWRNLENRSGFSLGLFGQKAHDIFPDFRSVNSMDDVAARIQVAINSVWSLLLNPGNPVQNWVTVSFDAIHRQLRVLSEVDGVEISAIGHPQSKWTSLFHTGQVLLTDTIAQTKTPNGLQNSQGVKHFSIVAHPTHRDLIYIGGSIQPTIDSSNAVGANDWVARIFQVNTAIGQRPEQQVQVVGTGANNTAPHGDSRFMMFESGNANLLEVDDGGIYRLLNVDTPATRRWVSLNGNLALSEISHAIYDPIADIISAGAQDVGNQEQVAPNSGVWRTVSKGDGNVQGLGYDVDVAGNPTGIVRYVFGNNFKVLTVWRFDLNQNPVVDPFRPTFKAPGNATDYSGLSANDAALKFNVLSLGVNALNGARILVGFNGLYESWDYGQTAYWVRPSTAKGTVTAIAYGGIDRNGLEFKEAAYVAFGKQIFYRETFAAGFVEAATNPPNAGSIKQIVMDPSDWRTAYAIDEKHLYATVDGGRTWVDITPAADTNGALPKDGLSSIEFVRQVANTGGQTNANIADLRIELRDGTAIDVTLANVVNLGQLKTAIQEASRPGLLMAPRITVDLDGEKLRLNAATAADAIARVLPLNGSLAALDLHLLAGEATIAADGMTLTGGNLNPASAAGVLNDAFVLSNLNTAYYVTGAVVNAGGNGYAANLILTVSGGSSAAPATLKVTGEAAGVINNVQVITGGSYQSKPGNPVSVSASSGALATFNLAWSERSRGVRVGKKQTDVLLVGGLDGVFRALNPLGSPAQTNADYRRLKTAGAEVRPAGANNDLIFITHGPAADFAGAAIRYVITVGVVKGAERIQALANPKHLVFEIHADTTALDILNALKRSPAHLAFYEAVLAPLDGGLVNDGSGKVGATTADVPLREQTRALSFREFGQSLPNAEVTEIFYTQPRILAGKDVGDVLLVGVRGRGAFKLTDASQYLSVENVLTVSGDENDNVITLALDSKNSTFAGLVIDGVALNVFQIATIDRIVLNGLGGNDTFEIDARLRVIGGIDIDGGAGAQNKIIVLGEHDAAQPAQSSGGRGSLVLQAKTNTMTVNFAQVQTVFSEVSGDNLAKFQKGLQSLTFDRLLTSALATKQVPLVGSGLGSILTSVSQADPPIGFPDSSFLPVEFRTVPQATTDTIGDLNSIFGRILQGGPGGFLISEIGKSITDLATLRTLLDDLDSTPNNVILTEGESSSSLDVRINRRFGGEGNIDFTALGGKLRLAGSGSFSIDVALHLVIGADDNGFFIMTDAVTGPELVLSNIQLLGRLDAVGRLGFIEVSLTHGEISLDPQVQVSVDLREPGPDPITGELDQKIRLHEFTHFSPLDFFTVQLVGNPAADDFVVRGNFGIRAILPGSSSGFSIVDAGLVFTWADINNLVDFDVTAQPGNPSGELLARLLDIDLQQLLLDLLAKVDSLGDQIRTLSALDTQLPLVNRSANELFMGTSGNKIGDLLKLHDPVAAYFQDLAAAGQSPTMSGLFNVVRDHLASKMQGGALRLELDYFNNSPQLKFTVEFHLNPALAFPLDAGDSLSDLGIKAASASVEIAADIDLDFSFGLDLGQLISTGAIGDAAFVEVRDLSAALELAVRDIDLAMDLGFLQATIDSAVISAEAGVSLKLTDPTPVDGRVTIADLTGSSFSTLFSIIPRGPVIRVGAVAIDLFVGANGGTPDEMGLRLSGRDLGFILFVDLAAPAGASAVTYALTASGSAALVGVDGLVLSGDLTVRVNTTGRALNEVIRTGGGDIAVSFGANETHYQRVEGTNITFGIGDFLYLNGAFVIEKIDTPSGVDVIGPNNVGGADGIDDRVATELRIGVTLHEAFVGSGRGSASEVGLRLEGGTLGVVLFSAADQSLTVQAASRYAVKGTLSTAGLVGIPGIQLSGHDLAVEINRTGETLSGLSVGIGADQTVDMSFATTAQVTRVRGGVLVQILDFVYVDGAFSIEKTDTLSGTDDIGPNNTPGADGIDDQIHSEIRLGASLNEAFIGMGRGSDDEIGVRVTGGTLGIILFSTTDQHLAVQAPSKYAVKGTLANASLVGVSGITLSASSLSVELNRTGQTLDGESVSTGPGGADVDMSFGSTADVTRASGAVTVQVFDFVYLEGTFSFEKIDTLSGNDTLSANNTPGADGIDDRIETKMEIGATLTEAFIGAGRGTADEAGLKFTGGSVGVVIFKTVDQSLAVQAASKVAVKGTLSSASLVGVNDLTLSATALSVEVNRTGQTLTGETVSTGPGGEVIDMSFASGSDVTRASGTVNIQIAGFVFITGSFSFAKTDTITPIKDATDTVIGTLTRTEIEIGATNVTVFLGTDYNTGQETGVKVTGASLGLILFQSIDTTLTTQAPSTYVIKASGTASLSGISGLTLSGSLAVKVNNTGKDFSGVNKRVIVTPGGNVEIDFASNLTRLEGKVNLEIGTFVSLTGEFSFQQTTATVGTATTTEIQVGVTNVEAFVGQGPARLADGTLNPDALGVHITEANLGLVLIKTVDPTLKTQAPAGYALKASGTVNLRGITGLDVSGTLHVKANTTGKNFSGANTRNISTPGGNIAIDHAGNLLAVEGSIQFTVGGAINLSGNFSFEKTGTTLADTRIKVGASAVTTSIQAGGVTVSLTQGSLALVLFGDGTYAVRARGTISVTGIPSLTFSGTLGFESNSHGDFAAPETISVGGETFTLDYTENFEAFSA
ncbi:MAG: LEPR-XLL domain-containing protein, partial [Verrucomicrobiota bacterium]